MPEFRLTVRGQQFLVRSTEPGVYHFDWLNGRPAYGFTSTTSDRSALDERQLRAAIERFLAQVNPETGYID